MCWIFFLYYFLLQTLKFFNRNNFSRVFDILIKEFFDKWFFRMLKQLFSSLTTWLHQWDQSWYHNLLQNESWWPALIFISKFPNLYSHQHFQKLWLVPCGFVHYKKMPSHLKLVWIRIPAQWKRSKKMKYYIKKTSTVL